MSDKEAVMRWDPYSLTCDRDFDHFWKSHLDERKRSLLLVVGRGFDFRALETAKRLTALGATLRIWLLAFDDGPDDSQLRSDLTQINHDGLIALAGSQNIDVIPIKIGGSSGATATSRNVQTALLAAGNLTDYDDVIVDISAMPRMVAMTAVALLLKQLDDLASKGEAEVNLHVTTAESVSADIGAAQGSLRDKVSFVQGFTGQLTAFTSQGLPRVWFPVLGEGQLERLDLIHEHLNPDEICPVIPFPSREPRRGDEIIYAHRDILFDTFQVEPGNILLACEYNPFEAYKQLFNAMDRYRRALTELGGCKAFISPLSSKLLSIGALLACYDHLFGKIPGKRLMVGIPYVETAAYEDQKHDEGSSYELYSLWIRGEWELLGEDGDASAGSAELLANRVG